MVFVQAEFTSLKNEKVYATKSSGFTNFQTMVIALNLIQFQILSNDKLSCYEHEKKRVHIYADHLASGKAAIFSIFFITI